MLKRGVRGLAKAALTLALFFVALCFVRTLLALPVGLDQRTAVWPATGGFCGGLLMFSLGLRFVRLYVAGHELTHWLAAKLFRRQTGKLTISAKGGSVAIERPNVFIVLAPYFVPLYTLIWIGLYGVALFVVPADNAALTVTFFIGVGLSYAFHVVLTTIALWDGQQDLRMFGPGFSLAVIAAANLALLFLALTVVDRDVAQGFKLLWRHSRANWHILKESVMLAAGMIRRLIV